MSEWIPIVTREMSEWEKEHYPEYKEMGMEMLNCPLPEDGEEVLVTLDIGVVTTDTFIRDCDGCYFECYDMEEVLAWMKIPAPYQKDSKKN